MTGPRNALEQSTIDISIELLRELLDLPDSIEIVAATLRTTGGNAGELRLLVNHPDPDAHVQITPVYEAFYEGDVKRIKLKEIKGYRGPLEPRPSTTREVRT